MSTIAKQDLPILEKIIDFVVALKCLTVSVLYLTAIKNTLSSLSEYFKFSEYELMRTFFTMPGWVVLLFLFIITTPLTFLYRIKPLKLTSVFGMLVLFAILGVTTNLKFKTQNQQELKFFTTNKNYHKAIAEVVYGFTCHQTIFMIQNEMKNKSLRNLLAIIILVMITTIAIYVYFGLINYKIFGDDVKINILELYCSKDRQTVAVLLLYIIMLLLSIPFQSIPCKLHVFNLFELQKSRKNNFLFSGSFLFFIYIVAIIEIDIGKLASFVGSFASSHICFTFAPVLYLKMAKKVRFMNWIACVTSLFGTFVTACWFLGMFFTI